MKRSRINRIVTRSDDMMRRFRIGRFANIQEDVDPKHLLVSDYRTWL